MHQFYEKKKLRNTCGIENNFVPLHHQTRNNKDYEKNQINGRTINCIG